MKSEKLLDAIGSVDDDLIEEAGKVKKYWGWKQWTAVAAALAIIICSTIIPLTHRSPGIPADTSPTEGLTIIPEISISGYEQGFVGDPSSVESPGNVDMEIRFPLMAVTAKAIETLPDTYYIIGDRENKFRLVRMETIRTLVGKNMVDSFYYILPEAYMTDLTKYDTLVITQIRQFSHQNSILYNETADELEIIDQVILGFYTYLSGSVITAFTDGLFDKELWYSTEIWTTEVGNQCSTPIDPSLEGYEQKVREDYGGGYTDAVYTHIEPENTEVSAALDYVKPFNNGVFIPRVSWYTNHSSAFYRRYANGYPTNETVYISSDSAGYSEYRFTAEDLTILPDLASGLKTVNEAYDAGGITAPHLKGWENMRLVRYVIFGWYAKTESSIYGIIRVSWCYADDTEESYYDMIHYDDQYYIVETSSDTCQAIDHEELTALLGKNADFVLGVDGYNEEGRIVRKQDICC